MVNKKTFGQIVAVKIDELKRYKNNARTHSEAQIGQIMESLREFGFTNPVLIDPKMGVIAGHVRLEAAKRLEMAEVPASFWPG
jgi:ParB-like chromosome segregation protein Spo0J